MIEPHGGNLINKNLPKIEKERILESFDDFEKIYIDITTQKVIKNIVFGVFSPLEGFMNQNDFQYVLDQMYL
ncbi:MAG: sulfate adenylyltransferase, partial [Promethearchaeota archaeon]